MSVSPLDLGVRETVYTGAGCGVRTVGSASVGVRGGGMVMAPSRVPGGPNGGLSSWVRDPSTMLDGASRDWLPSEVQLINPKRHGGVLHGLRIFQRFTVLGRRASPVLSTGYDPNAKA